MRCRYSGEGRIQKKNVEKVSDCQQLGNLAKETQLKTSNNTTDDARPPRMYTYIYIIYNICMPVLKHKNNLGGAASTGLQCFRRLCTLHNHSEGVGA